MHRACWGSSSRHTDTVRAFLEAGVPWDYPSVDTKGKSSMKSRGASGQTPMEMCRNDATKALVSAATVGLGCLWPLPTLTVERWGAQLVEWSGATDEIRKSGAAKPKGKGKAEDKAEL